MRVGLAKGLGRRTVGGDARWVRYTKLRDICIGCLSCVGIDVSVDKSSKSISKTTASRTLLVLDPVLLSISELVPPFRVFACPSGVLCDWAVFFSSRVVKHWAGLVACLERLSLCSLCAPYAATTLKSVWCSHNHRRMLFYRITSLYSPSVPPALLCLKILSFLPAFPPASSSPPSLSRFAPPTETTQLQLGDTIPESSEQPFPPRPPLSNTPEDRNGEARRVTEQTGPAGDSSG